ncbi:uncharacterized protein LOC141629182 [Silene latifolia]|uniref:uncharacterized protein LOC141629182 n=1 Tax=Silene latifolia TaxID=37657 RepID=UPI003D76B9D4
MLYWGEFSEKEECHVCHTSRWKTSNGEGKAKKGEGAKMRYFPLIPRLQRIYNSPKIAKDMRWHHKDRVKDGKLRHPADVLAWEQFDSRYPEFLSDPRSVRLALATDGFNPYRLMNTTYITWPVILIPYNLPPWLCMKPSSFILSCIIPGKYSLGSLFDGTTEYGSAPICATGSDVLRQQEGIDYIYGKSKKRRKRKNRVRKVGESTNVLINSDDDNNDNLWNKKSVFFKVPYWENNPLRHNLDVMHIEKNVCDNILGTLLDMDKSRDDENARKDLEKLGVKRHLWLKYLPNGGKYMPQASYSMSSEEKDRFLKVLQKVRVPDGYGSNKSYVRNKSQPEGSIAEGYILEETITFCSRYLEGVETTYNRSKRNDDVIQDMDCYLYQSGGRVIGVIEKVRLDDKSLKQAHRYVLLHSDEMKVVLDTTRITLPLTPSDENDWIINEFSDWLQIQVQNLDTSTKEGQLRKALAGGLTRNGKRMTGYMINGYKFQTVYRELHRKTQNYGIMVEADGHIYYGKLKGISELDYFGKYKVVMFRCDWVDIHKGIKSYPDKSVCVNFSKLMHTGRNLSDDSFVFSSQAKQVFYVEDEMHKGWLHDKKGQLINDELSKQKNTGSDDDEGG